jgi:hypothetical protein
VTLQYRIRSKYEDDIWRQRVYLCEQLAAEEYDAWCRSTERLPETTYVASLLFLFSPRCDPFTLRPYHLAQQLASLVQSPEREYELTWARRPPAKANELIEALRACLTKAERLWEQARGPSQCSAGLASQIVDEIVGQQYVVFHHFETTRRDANHWGI